MSYCLNCGATLTGRYCAECGQEHITGRPSLGRLLSELTASLVDADSRLWRTLGILMLHPGRLPQLYFAGRRVRYLPPWRLYLATSLIFFMFLAAGGSVPVVDSEAGAPLDEQELAAAASELSEATANAEGESDTSLPFDITGELSDCDINYTGPMEEFIGPRVVYTCKRAMLDNGLTLLDEFASYLPTAMFLLMPVFALSMKLFYWRPQRYFMEHLLFQLFNHSALFIAGTTVRLIGWVVPANWDGRLQLALFGYIFFYAYKSLRVFYGQRRRVTVLKFLALGLVYLQLAIVAFLFAGVATVI